MSDDRERVLRLLSSQFIAILLKIHESKVTNVATLTRNSYNPEGVASGAVVTRVRRQMRELGLITEEVRSAQRRGGKWIDIRLTERGRRVAELFVEIIELIASSHS